MSRSELIVTCIPLVVLLAHCSSSSQERAQATTAEAPPAPAEATPDPADEPAEESEPPSPDRGLLTRLAGVGSSDMFRQVEEHLLAHGFEQVGERELVEQAANSTQSRTVRVRAGRCYFAVAVGGYPNTLTMSIEGRDQAPLGSVDMPFPYFRFCAEEEPTDVVVHIRADRSGGRYLYAVFDVASDRNDDLEPLP